MSLVLQYNFNNTNISGDNLQNLANNNYNAEINNNPTINQPGPNNNLQAITFNGINQFITVNGIETNNTGISFSFWFKSNNNSTWARIFDFGNGPSSNNIIAYINSGNLGFSVYANGPNYQPTNVISNVNDNNWRHVVWTLTYPTGWNIYLNGNLVANFGAGIYPVNMLRNNQYIGQSNWPSDPHYNGSIADFRMYNTVLSVSQIENIYNYNPTANQNAGTYIYQGCFNDSGNRAIPNYMGQVSSVQQCEQIAQNSGQNVFGVQYYGQCFAGNSLNQAQQYGPNNGDCGTLGSSWTNQVYANEPPQTSNQYVYRGCYNDSGNRAIPSYVGNVGSVDQCAQMAQQNNATVFGVQYYGQCFVGNIEQQAYQYGVNNNYDSCGPMGEAWTNQVYSIPAYDQCSYIMSNSELACYKNRYPDLASFTNEQLQDHWTNIGCNEKRSNQCISPQTSSGLYQFKGCYNDTGNRAVPTFQGNVSSVDECAQIAEQNKQVIFSVQDGSQCFTGNNEQQAYEYGNNVNRTQCGPMGEAWTNQVYVRSTPFPPPIPPVPVLTTNNFNSKENFSNKSKKESFSNKSKKESFSNKSKKDSFSNKSKKESFSNKKIINTGFNQMYNEIFCNLFPTNNGFSECRNCNYQFDSSDSPRSSTQSGYQECLTKCNNDDWCTSFNYTPSSDKNCIEHSSFPTLINNNVNGTSSGYSLSKFTYDYNNLSSDQQNNIQMKCGNQYLNNIYTPNKPIDLSSCLTILEGSQVNQAQALFGNSAPANGTQSASTNLNVDPQCLYNKYKENGINPPIINNSVYQNMPQYTKSVSDPIIDNYKKIYTSYSKKQGENLDINNYLSSTDSTYTEYNDKVGQEKSLLKTKFTRSINELKQRTNEVSDKIINNTQSNMPPMPPKIPLMPPMPPMQSIEQFDNSINYSSKSNILMFIIILIILFIILFFTFHK